MSLFFEICIGFVFCFNVYELGQKILKKYKEKNNVLLNKDGTSD